MSKESKSVLIRFYDEKNLGDDLFVKIITERYLNQFVYITRKSGHPFIDMPNLTALAKSRVYFKLWRGVDRVMGRTRTWMRLAARKYHTFIYVGGSIFMEQGDIEMWRREEVFYQNLSIPYYILGSNVGPYRSTEFLDIVSKIFAGAKDVCLRDQASKVLVPAVNNVRVATDIAFTLDTAKYIQASVPQVVISIIDGSDRFEPGIVARYEQYLADLATALLRKGYRVIFMSFCQKQGDEAAASRVIEMLDESYDEFISKAHYNGDLESALHTIAKSEIVIGSRFHAVILGLVFGKKVLPMAYSAKTTDILEDMDFQGPVIDITKIGESDARDFDFDSLKSNDITSQRVLAENQFFVLDAELDRKA